VESLTGHCVTLMVYTGQTDVKHPFLVYAGDCASEFSLSNSPIIILCPVHHSLLYCMSGDRPKCPYSWHQFALNEHVYVFLLF